MKKSKCLKSLFAGILLVMLFYSGNTFSQGVNWRINGNNNVSKNDFIGTKNNADFVIRTNNQERIRVTTDNYTVFEDSVRIKGHL